MRKKSSLFIVLSILAVILSGCMSVAKSKNDLNADIIPAQENHLVYTNLLDKESQNEVLERLENAGVTESDIDTFEKLVKKYNQLMTVFEESDLDYMESKEDFFNYQNGFVDTTDPYISYGDYYNYMKKWYNAGDDEDILCRILAFMLIQNNIQINQYVNEKDWAVSNEDSYLYSDIGCIDKNAVFTFTQEQKAAYFTLFNPVKMNGVISNESMFEAIKTQWTQYGISFSDSNLSMISIWTEHDGVVHNSHAGILIDDEQGLLFIEKTNPLFPYQATKFATREQLKEYMLNTLSAGFKQDDLSVPGMIVMENDSMME